MAILREDPIPASNHSTSPPVVRPDSGVRRTARIVGVLFLAGYLTYGVGNLIATGIVDSDDRGDFFRTATRHSMEHATRFIVPSRATRDELVRMLGFDAIAAAGREVLDLAFQRQLSFVDDGDIFAEQFHLG